MTKNPILFFICIVFLVSEPALSESTNQSQNIEISEEGQSDPDALIFADQFPEVLEVDVVQRKNNSWRFSVTLSSPYDTPKRYADAWRVLDSEGRELGIRILGHDHANEQPFTRSKSIELPDNISTVYVEGRDQVNGWSGQRFEVKLP